MQFFFKSLIAENITIAQMGSNESFTISVAVDNKFRRLRRRPIILLTLANTLLR